MHKNICKVFHVEHISLLHDRQVLRRLRLASIVPTVEGRVRLVSSLPTHAAMSLGGPTPLMLISNRPK
jgi:hypothetical protein